VICPLTMLKLSLEWWKMVWGLMWTMVLVVSGNSVANGYGHGTVIWYVSWWCERLERVEEKLDLIYEKWWLSFRWLSMGGWEKLFNWYGERGQVYGGEEVNSGRWWWGKWLSWVDESVVIWWSRTGLWCCAMTGKRVCY